MINNIILRWLTIAILLSVCQLISGQSVIGDINLSIPIVSSECASINVGETIQFTRTSNCSGNILIEFNGDVVLNSSELSPSYIFNDPGQYVVFCGAAPNSVAVPKACFIVENIKSIPTLSEWSLICLFLLFNIICIVSLQFDSFQSLSKK